MLGAQWLFIADCFPSLQSIRLLSQSISLSCLCTLKHMHAYTPFPPCAEPIALGSTKQPTELKHVFPIAGTIPQMLCWRPPHWACSLHFLYSSPREVHLVPKKSSQLVLLCVLRFKADIFPSGSQALRRRDGDTLSYITLLTTPTTAVSCLPPHFHHLYQQFNIH